MESKEAVQTLFLIYNCSIGRHRVTYQDLETRFWLAKETITPPYRNSISRSAQQTLPGDIGFILYFIPESSIAKNKDTN